MKRTIILFIVALTLSLGGYTVYSASNYDISLNEAAPFPENM
jgi:hypothetical protein